MITASLQYWPFSTATGAETSVDSEKADFLSSAFARGFQAFKCGFDDYGARSSTREGLIVVRGRDRWEIRLWESDLQQLRAFVKGFSFAGEAVRNWLDGQSTEEILHQLDHQLIALPGIDSKYELAPLTAKSPISNPKSSIS